MPTLSSTGYRFGLIGYPLEHSRSPQLHQAALRACGLPGQYELLPIPPDEVKGLARVIHALRTGKRHGINVTIPHKTRVLAWVDELDPAAGAIRAVNTLVPRGGRVLGANTDAPGFWEDLVRAWPVWADGPARGLILGAGGAARAVAYALLSRGWEVVVVARRYAAAQQLLTDLSAPPERARALDWQAFARGEPAFGPEPWLIVNATPVGMWPHTNASPWPQHRAWPTRGAAYDLVYNPRVTQFMRQARAAGLPARDGLGMLVEQAVRAFVLWTNANPTCVRKAMAQTAGLITAPNP
ncbi:MAG: shikimate dehydrogenase [Chloroflexi bacterium]|nr:shikimate dehydrogenase [Chloroflexota bacterium]